jgi:hypothetical protein
VIGAWFALKIAALWQHLEAAGLALADLSRARAERWRARWR